MAEESLINLQWRYLEGIDFEAYSMNYQNLLPGGVLLSFPQLIFFK